MALWGLTCRHFYCLSWEQIGLMHHGIPLFCLLNNGKNACFSPSQLSSPSHRRWLSYSTCTYCVHIVFLIDALCTRIICIDFLDNQMHGLTFYIHTQVLPPPNFHLNSSHSSSPRDKTIFTLSEIYQFKDQSTVVIITLTCLLSYTFSHAFTYPKKITTIP